MEEKDFIKLVNEQLVLSPMEKNALYHNLLVSIKEGDDAKAITQEIWSGIITLLEEKRSTLEQMVSGELPSHKPGLFRRVPS